MEIEKWKKPHKKRWSRWAAGNQDFYLYVSTTCSTPVNKLQYCPLCRSPFLGHMVTQTRSLQSFFWYHKEKARAFMSPGSWSYLLLQDPVSPYTLYWAVLCVWSVWSQATQPASVPVSLCHSPPVAIAMEAFTGFPLQFLKIPHSTCPPGHPSNIDSQGPLSEPWCPPLLLSQWGNDHSSWSPLHRLMGILNQRNPILVLEYNYKRYNWNWTHVSWFSNLHCRWSWKMMARASCLGVDFIDGGKAWASSKMLLPNVVKDPGSQKIKPPYSRRIPNSSGGI